MYLFLMCADVSVSVSCGSHFVCPLELCFCVVGSGVLEFE